MFLDRPDLYHVPRLMAYIIILWSQHPNDASKVCVCHLMGMHVYFPRFSLEICTEWNLYSIHFRDMQIVFYGGGAFINSWGKARCPLYIVASYPGSFPLTARGRKEPGNIGGFKPLTSGAWILAAPIRLQNESTCTCDYFVGVF